MGLTFTIKMYRKNIKMGLNNDYYIGTGLTPTGYEFLCLSYSYSLVSSERGFLLYLGETTCISEKGGLAVLGGKRKSRWHHSVIVYIHLIYINPIGLAPWGWTKMTF